VGFWSELILADFDSPPGILAIFVSILPRYSKSTLNPSTQLLRTVLFCELDENAKFLSIFSARLKISGYYLFTENNYGLVKLDI
jgi:hypothetical protein